MLDHCAQCGAPLADGATACTHCGTSAPASEATPAPVPFVPTFAMEPDLEGIGGWLILVAIGLAVAPFRSMHGIYVDLHVLYGSKFQYALSLHHGLAGLILYEAVTNSFFLFALITLNYLFYDRRKTFPSLMITYLAVQLVLGLIDHLAALQFSTHQSPTAVLGNFVAAAVWIPYYLKSERVKATFVR